MNKVEKAAPTERGVLDVLAAAQLELSYLEGDKVFRASEGIREARAAVAELIEAADDWLNGEDTGASCDDHVSAAEARIRIKAERLERLRSALASAQGGES